MTQYTPPPNHNASQQFTEYAPPPKPSGLAIASLVLAILGFCTGGLTGLIGLILGITAVIGINKSQGRISGSGLAIAGIVVGALSMLCLPLQIAMFLPAFTQARLGVKNARATGNLHQIDGALRQYANDNN